MTLRRAVAVVVAVAAVGGALGIGLAAEPAAARLTSGSTVNWSGGPLSGTANPLRRAGPRPVDPCPETSCDRFTLTISPPPHIPPGTIPVVDIRVETKTPEQLTLIAIPPHGDPQRSYFDYRRLAARLLDPVAGDWTLRVECSQGTGTSYMGLPACAQATYKAKATMRLGARGNSGSLHRAGGVLMSGTPPEGISHQVGVQAAEPTLGVTADGTLFFQGCCNGNYLMRSDDDGRTWKNIAPVIGALDAQQMSLDPYMYIDRTTSRVFYTNLSPTLCTQISFTDDRGETWTHGAGCGNTDYQKIFAGPPVFSVPSGYPNVVYYCAINGGLGDPASTMEMCGKSLDGGRTYVPTGTPPFIDDPGQKNHYGLPAICGGGAGPGAVDADGVVYLPRGWCGQPRVAISRDEGTTWERVQVADLGVATWEDGYKEQTAAIDVDSDGNLYFTWIARDRFPYVVISRDGGATWGTPIMVGPPGLKEANIPDIRVGAPGKIAVVYMGSTNSPHVPFSEPQDCTEETQKCVDVFLGNTPPADYTNTTWNGYITVSPNVLDANPTFYTAPVNDPADPLVRGACGPQRCQVEYDFLDVQIAPDGTAWAAFSDGCMDTVCHPTVGAGVAGHLAGAPSLLDAPPPKPSPSPRPTPPVVRGTRRALPSTGVGDSMVVALLVMAMAAVGIRAGMQRD